MKTFYFKEEDLIDKEEDETEFDDDEFERFEIGELVSDYYEIKKEVLKIKNKSCIEQFERE